MKIRIVIIALLLCGGLLSAQAQLYQTSGTANYTPAVSGGNAYNNRSVYPAVSSSMPAIETPYSDPRFSSTAVMNNNTYTIMFSAQSMSAGVAQEPAYISPIYKAPTGPGGGIGPGNDPDDIVIDITPVGDGMWVLLCCIAMLTALRAWHLRRTKRA
ncbi:MAG: hypothetical protein ACI3Z8_08635 [Paludibacteraceae bacterium]